MTYVFRFSTVAVVLVLATKIGFVALDVAHREDGLPIEKRIAKLIYEDSRYRNEWEESFSKVAAIIESISIVRYRLARIFDRLSTAVKTTTVIFSTASMCMMSDLEGKRGNNGKRPFHFPALQWVVSTF